jgi:hypothetical protein
MPSKKKKKSSRGKVRKGVSNKDKEEEKFEIPDAQMQRLKIDEDFQSDDDALLEKAIKLAAAEKSALEAAAAEQEKTSKRLVEKHSNGDGCNHGFVTTDDLSIIDPCIILDFAKTFTSAFVGEKLLGESLRAAEKVTREKYPEVWNDSSKLNLVKSLFLFNGTQEVLKGDIYGARSYASLARYFEEHIAVYLHKRKVTMDATKMLELMRGDEHTLVKYLRKLIPCNCLDEKYKEVKFTTKMGLCFNLQCHVPDRMVERRSMLYCTRCRQANYCSPKCQKAAWPEHKELCDAHVMARAEQDSRK